jgi:hypothetical protein
VAARQDGNAALYRGPMGEPPSGALRIQAGPPDRGPNRISEVLSTGDSSMPPHQRAQNGIQCPGQSPSHRWGRARRGWAKADGPRRSSDVSGHKRIARKAYDEGFRSRAMTLGDTGRCGCHRRSSVDVRAALPPWRHCRACCGSALLATPQTRMFYGMTPIWRRGRGAVVGGRYRRDHRDSGQPAKAWISRALERRRKLGDRVGEPEVRRRYLIKDFSAAHLRPPRRPTGLPSAFLR